MDWEDHIDQIPEQFDKMGSKDLVDHQKFYVEYYRSQKELILMVPIKLHGATKILMSERDRFS